MILNGSSLLIGPGPGPFPVPVNFVQVPQMSPQGSGHHHLMHHPPPPPSHQQHHPHPHNTIYGPLPGPPTGAPPPPPGSTAYSVRTRLRRGHSSGGPVPGEYPLMFAGPGEEPIYIPPMRPLTPLSNYHGHHHTIHHQQLHSHHPHHPHHQQTESHYVSYPVTYGTTPRRDKYRSKDKTNGNSRSVLGSSSGPNGGGNGGGTTGEETERDSSPSAVGLYKRKGHLNERAFSYSIRQEHRSRSNSLANLTIEDSPGRPIVNGSAGGSGSSGGERGDDENIHNYHHHSHHHSNRHSHHHDSRRGSSSAFGERERERPSAHSSGNFDRHGTTNGGHYNGSRDSFIDYREAGRGNEMSSLSASMANLNFNGHNNLESKNVPKTASIKRSSKQRNSLGSKGMPIAPPLPPPTSHAMNGKSMDVKSMRKL